MEYNPNDQAFLANDGYGDGHAVQMMNVQHPGNGQAENFNSGIFAKAV